MTPLIEAKARFDRAFFMCRAKGDFPPVEPLETVMTTSLNGMADILERSTPDGSEHASHKPAPNPVRVAPTKEK